MAPVVEAKANGMELDDELKHLNSLEQRLRVGSIAGSIAYSWTSC